VASRAECPNFSPNILAATPIVKVAIESENLYDMQKLIQGLEILNKSDGSVEVYI
jgi:ribosome assembly protein 1